MGVLGRRGVVELVGHVQVLRLGLARERHVDLVVALGGTRLVLIIVVHVNRSRPTKCEYLSVSPD